MDIPGARGEDRGMNLPPPHSTLAPPPWHAELALRFSRVDGATRLTENRHRGPLRVQKPLYPKGRDACEALLLHPPGGIAGGDALDIGVQVDEGAHALLSTPGAAKWYRSAGRAATQRIALHVAAAATLEWLPQEAILFDGADAVQVLGLHLARGSATLGWDIVQLGRTAAGDDWPTGRFRQSLNIARDGHPVFVEWADLRANDPTRHGLTGLAGYPVMGMLWATSPRLAAAPEAALEAVRAAIGAGTGLHEAGHWVQAPLCAAATWLPAPAELLLVRALGCDAEPLRALLEAAWAALRPPTLGRAAYRPRIWAT